MTIPIMAEPIGTTVALQEVSIRARVRGFLREIHFQEGGDVKAGQLLFVIDEEPFQVKQAEAQARLEAAEAELKKAKDSKAREVATAQLALNQAVLALNRVEEARQIALIRRNAASQEDVDRAVAIRKRTRPRSSPTRPAWSRPGPTTTRTSWRPRPTSPRRSQRSSTPRSTWATAA